MEGPKNEKKSFQPHLFEPPGRSTGNRIIFMDSLKLPQVLDFLIQKVEYIEIC